MKRDYNNPFDSMFDIDGDGKIDMLEQYAEIDYLSGGQLSPGDGIMELAHDYFMHSGNPDPTFPLSLVDEDEEEDEDDEDDYGDDSFESD